ncbi:toll/interleukin-1 receptor domain-containing protein [Metarhizobium album]|uniref:Toll/interleukin-1 receptor domain-containing protein n=1 Tax=Metarhizobium album TaxID=2182425 RepID=A0A2U2DFW6_9HYPH|nr:toll/interleukin-1 receptor domain-containing protein [Rhizobium album]PWE52131.1 toll/interleukin-1 receptor domain-containing protein [Rhizobium album]
MALNAFISYSHADEKYLERLHKHMALLQRERAIETWTDHQIVPGGKLDGAVAQALERSDVFIALVSPDYLASNYCYDKEFEVALRMAESGKLHILPVIVEPCDWLSSPFSQFLALPKDGKPISEWTNSNVAYLDVISGVRRLVSTGTAQTAGTDKGATSPASSGRRIKIKQEFDSIQKGEFTDQAFGVISDYFRNSCDEINGIEDLRAKFHQMNEGSFTCTVVNRGIKGGREAHITVHNGKGGRHHFGDINYVFEAHAGTNTSNGAISVAADDYNMYLTLGFGSMMGRDDSKLDAPQAAEALWLEFTGQAGIEYD